MSDADERVAVGRQHYDGSQAGWQISDSAVSISLATSLWRRVVLRLHLKGSRLALSSEAAARPTWREHRLTIRCRYSKPQRSNTLAGTVETVCGHEIETIAEVCWRVFQAWMRLLTPDTRVVHSGAVAGSVEDIGRVGRWIKQEAQLPLDAPPSLAKTPDMVSALAGVQLRQLSEFLVRRAARSGTWWRDLIAVAGNVAGIDEHGRANRAGFTQPITKHRWKGQGDLSAFDRLPQNLVLVQKGPSPNHGEIEHVGRALLKLVVIG